MKRISIRSGSRLLTTLGALALAGTLPAAGHADASLFCGADAPVFGDRLVEVSGGSAILGAEGGATRVRSNAKIVLNGHSAIEGDAVSGGAVKLTGKSQVSGAVIEHEPAVVTPESVHDLVASYEFDNDNHTIPVTSAGAQALHGTELKLSGGDSLEIGAGDYYLTRVKLSGHASLRVYGEVRIHMPHGSFDISGGSLAAGHEGSTLMVVMAGPGVVSSSGGSNFHGAIYAPEARVDVTGQGESWAGVVSAHLKLSGGSRLHAEEICVAGPPEVPGPFPPCELLCPVPDGY